VCDNPFWLQPFLDFFLHFSAGGLPGPVLFGFAMDHSCLLWEEKYDGSTGACLYYDNHQMAWQLMAVCTVCKLFNIVCGLLSWRLYMRSLRKGDVRETRPERRPTVGQTGNGPTGSNVELAANQTTGINNPAAEADNLPFTTKF